VDEGLGYLKLCLVFFLVVLVWSLVCKLFFSTFVLAVKGFINLKLGTRAFRLKTYRRRDEARFFIEFEFITACDWYKKTRWTY
jgi:hypothetical protein